MLQAKKIDFTVGLIGGRRMGVYYASVTCECTFDIYYEVVD